MQNSDSVVTTSGMWTGRIGRRQYLLSHLLLSGVTVSSGGFLVLLMLFVGFIFDWSLAAFPLALLLGSVLGSGVLVILFLLSLSLSARRLHDINASGWWGLFYLIPPAGLIMFLLLLFMAGDHSVNRYGEVNRVGLLSSISGRR